MFWHRCRSGVEVLKWGMFQHFNTLNTLQQLTPISGEYARLGKETYILPFVHHWQIPLIRFVELFQNLVQVIVGRKGGIGWCHQFFDGDLIVYFRSEDGLPHIGEVDDTRELSFAGAEGEGVASGRKGGVESGGE